MTLKTALLGLLLLAARGSAWLLGGSGVALPRQGTARCVAPPLMQQAKKKRAPKKSGSAVSQKRQDSAVDEKMDEAMQQARKTLLDEIAKEQRTMATVSSAIATLESAPSPTKLKRAVVGDWKLVYASDESAVAPFAVGASSGPFVVLEDIFHRFQSSGDAVQSIEGAQRTANCFGIPQPATRLAPCTPRLTKRSVDFCAQWCGRSARLATAALRSTGAGVLPTTRLSRGGRSTCSTSGGVR